MDFLKIFIEIQIFLPLRATLLVKATNKNLLFPEYNPNIDNKNAATLHKSHRLYRRPRLHP